MRQPKSTEKLGQVLLLFGKTKYILHFLYLFNCLLHFVWKLTDNNYYSWQKQKERKKEADVLWDTSNQTALSVYLNNESGQPLKVSPARIPPRKHKHKSLSKEERRLTHNFIILCFYYNWKHEIRSILPAIRCQLLQADAEVEKVKSRFTFWR